MSKKLRKLNLIFIGSLFLFSFLNSRSDKFLAPSRLGKYNGLPVRVCAEPEVSFDKQQLVLCSDKGKILTSVPLYPEFYYGDLLTLSGKLELPRNFTDFDYALYLEAKDIYLLSYYPGLNLVGHQESFWRQLFSFKASLARKIKQSLPEPESGLAQALVLGYRRSLDPVNRERFSATGLSHMIAISGSHITILSVLLLNSLLFLGLRRRFAFYALSAFLAFYVLLTGLQAPAFRSAIMGVLVLWAYQAGRISNLLNGLLISTSVMMVFNPRLLKADIGFQLSLAAVLGIIYIYPALRRVKILSGSKLGDIMCLTLACQLATAPILIYYFGRLSLVAPISNLLILWIFPFLLWTLLLAIILSFIFPSLSLALFYPSYLLLKLVLIGVKIMAAAPWAVLEFSN
ncbi:MAG: ComEC/Rec2 family competence protein [Patescibacteria group bacterium]